MKRMYGKYKCRECGEIFRESEIKVVEENRGEFWGFPCTERMHYSPCCMASFEEAYEDEEELIDE